jgi:hypothetical protein
VTISYLRGQCGLGSRFKRQGFRLIRNLSGFKSLARVLIFWSFHHPVKYQPSFTTASRFATAWPFANMLLNSHLIESFGLATKNSGLWREVRALKCIPAL